MGQPIVIIPAAGLSTRYDGDKPKYVLYDYQGIMLIDRVIRPFLDMDMQVCVAVLREHVAKFRTVEHIQNAFENHPASKNLSFYVIQSPTKGPAYTVADVLKNKYAGLDIQFLVKDCDSFYDIDPNQWYGWSNVVFTYDLNKTKRLRNPANKSYVITNREDTILTIVEKEVVSSRFCCGGYMFRSSEEYLRSFDHLSNNVSGELFVSHVISHMMSRVVFAAENVNNLVDLGTQEEWDEWNDKPTIFCDIDGTLVVSKDRLSYHEKTVVHTETLDLLTKKLKEGCQIIFTTARPNKDYGVTRKMLNDIGFEDCMLIVGLHNARRILVNDYNITTNKYPAAVAFNVLRDSDTLPEMLK